MSTFSQLHRKVLLQASWDLTQLLTPLLQACNKVSVAILIMEEITYSDLNLTEIGLVKFVNAMSCTFIQKSIIPTKENMCL